MAVELLTHAYPALALAFRNRRVVVTGGAGFIGSHLTAALCALGAEVVVVDSLISSSRQNLVGLPCRVLPVDITAGRNCAPAFKHASIVFHLAALGSVPRSLEDPFGYVRTNIVGTTNVLQLARAAAVKRVVFAASSSAYGDSPELPKTETMLPQPLSPYAATKVAGEQLMHAYAHSFGITTVSLRYFNVFGPRQSASSAYAAVIAAFASALLQGNPPVIFGDGTQSRDFTPVANVVLANLLAAIAPHEKVAGRVYNVGCGRSISVNELASQMQSLTQRPDLVPEYRPARGGDVLHSLADLSQAKADLGYKPIVDFETGLRETVDWYRSAAGISRTA